MRNAGNDVVWLGRELWRVLSVAFNFVFLVYGVRGMFSSDKERRYEGNGYFVWGAALLVFAVPELYGSFAGKQGAVPTLSSTVGNLINRHNWVSVLVIAILFGCVLHVVRVQVPATISRALPGTPDASEPGTGQWMMMASESGRLTGAKGEVPLPVSVWYVAIAFVLTVVAFVVPLLAHAGKQTVGLCGYGVLFTLLFLVPGFLAKRHNTLVSFPALFTTVRFLEAKSAVIAFVLGFGLVFLALHLTFYPFPSILPDIQGLHHHCQNVPTPPICVNPTP